MPDSPEDYVKKNWSTAIFGSFAIIFILFSFFKSFVVFLLFPIIFFFVFSYFMRFVDVKIKKIKGQIDAEIIFVGRYLLIELESGVPIYQTFQNIAENYEAVGSYFYEIIDKIDLGTPIEEALNESIQIAPSPNLRKILWQVLNSFKTGSDIRLSLNIVIDQIVREHQILAEEYGRKLNPLAMFYMMMAIIAPSLGVTMLTVLGTFLGLNISLVILLVIVVLVGFVQFMFLAMIRSSRPPVDV